MDRPDELLSNGPQAERLHRFAHDIRNRIAGMHQVLQQLAADTDRAGLKELAEFGEQQQFKALREVEELLDDLGVVRHLYEMPCSTLALGTVVRRAMGLVTHRLDRKQQAIDMQVREGVLVQGHEEQLVELVAALLSNASKFSVAGSTVHVSQSEDDGNVILHIRDEGVGLTPGDVGMVFQRYAWLSSRSTAGEAQGRSTLARAREWARAMRGDLKASSEGAGQGSTFSLTLRAADLRKDA
jgi:signal transduction histidine kinase